MYLRVLCKKPADLDLENLDLSALIHAIFLNVQQQHEDIAEEEEIPEDVKDGKEGAEEEEDSAVVDEVKEDEKGEEEKVEQEGEADDKANNADVSNGDVADKANNVNGDGDKVDNNNASNGCGEDAEKKMVEKDP